jgi:hypothetical protein
VKLRNLAKRLKISKNFLNCSINPKVFRACDLLFRLFIMVFLSVLWFGTSEIDLSVLILLTCFAIRMELVSFNIRIWTKLVKEFIKWQ